MSTTIKAWYNGQQMYMGVPDNALVFNGEQFVRPQDAKWVMLAATTPVGPKVAPLAWPETNTLDTASLTWTNRWQCQVISVGGPTQSSVDLTWIVDPNNGTCICGVSCPGTELQYVVVTPSVIVIYPPGTPTLPGNYVWPTNISNCVGVQPIATINLPLDLPPPASDDTLLHLASGQTLRTQILHSVGGVDIGLLVTGIS